ncbi:hypothetical protein N657DRAFT_637678 [Parathielavia appendiculata]|uniref:Transposase n=1 Tax=Parathielavia appendiculata TaxID=2587402 RepID=A0AAN6YYI1_9PEZI|nr:hypothetical protein N657DRAFT_637678 [Parathielavia appendiculata]
MVCYDPATRAQAVALKLVANSQIEAITGLNPRTIKSFPALVLEKHVCDAPKSGRPSKQGAKKDAVLEKVRQDWFGQLGNTISPMTVWRILRAAGMKKTKPAHWKRVIWSDETSVVMNHRRGGYRVWRTPEEKFFWGCFSYDSKGPCHIWHPETPQERKAAQKDLEELNAKLEPIPHEQ